MPRQSHKLADAESPFRPMYILQRFMDLHAWCRVFLIKPQTERNHIVALKSNRSGVPGPPHRNPKTQNPKPQTLNHTLTYQNLQKSRVPINSILGFIIRTYQKVGFGRLRYRAFCKETQTPEAPKSRHTLQKLPRPFTQRCKERTSGEADLCNSLSSLCKGYIKGSL